MSTNSLQTTGFQTSIDLAKNKTYDISTVAGVKRSQDQRSPLRPSLSSAAEPAAGIGGFGRPTFNLKPASVNRATTNQIGASKIHSVSSISAQSSVPSQPREQKTSTPVPGPTQNPLLSLSHPKYGLPGSLVRNFENLGIHSIYPWQSSCLLGRGLLAGEKNLVYTAPTGGGKSLVADILMLKRIIDQPEKKAILVLPYVALVQENGCAEW